MEIIYLISSLVLFFAVILRMKSRVDVAERKLGEALGLLRESDNWVRVLRIQFGYSQTKELADRVDVLISASAEPAKE